MNDQASGNKTRQQIVEIRQTSSSDKKAFEKRTEITNIIIDKLRTTGTFFQTERGWFYFSNPPSAKLYPLEWDSQELAALIDSRFGLSRAESREYDHLLNGLKNEALLRGKAVEINQLAHYDQNKHILYVSRFDGQVYRLDGCTIETVSNGTDGIFFWDDPQWEPYRIEQMPEGGSSLFDKLILSSANVVRRDQLSADDQRWLFRTWMLAQFFDSLHPTKSLLLICGEKGSGKTLALRKWLKLLFGSKAEVSALERNKADGFVAAVTSQPIAIFDNVDEHISWLPDNLARLVTGISFQRRKYYTTNEQVGYVPHCWLGLTSRTPTFVNGREDVLERTIILQAARLKEYHSENSLLLELIANRNRLWTDLLHQLNRVVGFLRANGHESGPVQFRMADFASFALSLAESEGKRQMALGIFARMEQRQSELLWESEPIYECLSAWLDDRKNPGRRVTSGALQPELQRIAESLKLTWPYQNARSLGQRLSHISSNLSLYFAVESGTNSANQRWYEFYPKTESLNATESPSEGDSACESGLLQGVSEIS